MAVFDKRLIDPDARALAGELGRAMRAANRENRYQTNRMERDAAFWARFAHDVLKTGGPDGRRRSCKGGRAVPEVIAGWWTDPAGRKHVRVIGRTRFQYSRHRGEVELRSLPPWWQVYPEAVLGVRQKDGGERYIAACRCGAIGTPESLGWMGDTCGPCFDRRADGGALAGGFGQFAGWAAHLSRFGFSPDGRHLIGQALTGAVRAVDRADGAAVTGRKRLLNHVVAIAPGTDGTVIAFHDGTVVRWPADAADVEVVLKSRQVWGRVALAPNGSRITLASYQETFTADLTATRPQYARHGQIEGYSVLKYTPDGARLLGTTYTGELRAVDVARGTSEPLRRDAFETTPGFAPPNDFVLSADGGAALVRRQSYHPYRVLVRHVPLDGGKTVDLRIPEWHQPGSFAYSPDGAHAVTAETQSGWVGFWEVASGKSLGFVRAVVEDQVWQGGQVEFAPGGGAVAVGYSTGHPEHGSTVAVWPWPDAVRAAGG